MGKRINVENPFYSSDASASAFGWEFQVNAAIYLFLKYLESVESIKVEGKYQDIELKKTDGKTIYAQAKSVRNGSLDHRKEKLEDAIISLAKTPADKEDSLLYVSNYSAPINRADVFKNSVLSLKDAEEEKESFIEQKNHIEEKLKIKINNCEKPEKKRLYEKLLSRLSNLDVDRFLVCSIYPYMNCEQEYDKYRVISDKIKEILTNNFGINSPYILKFVKNILCHWHETFLYKASMPDNQKEKTMKKTDLLWQIVVIISDIEVDMSQLLEEELGQDEIDEAESYYVEKLFVHERFKFINKLMMDLSFFRKENKGSKNIDFIKSNWEKYKSEFVEYEKYAAYAQEYLIKKCLYKFINNRQNINKIIEGK